MPTLDGAPLIFIAVFFAVLAHHMWHKQDRLLALIPAVIGFTLVWQNFPAAHALAAALMHAAGLTAGTLAPAFGSLVLFAAALLGIKIMFAPPKKKKRGRKSAR